MNEFAASAYPSPASFATKSARRSSFLFVAGVRPWSFAVEADCMPFPYWQTRSPAFFLEMISLLSRISRVGPCCVLLVLSCALGGCGGSSPSLESAPPPHQGSMISLPDGKGSVEVVKKTVDASSKTTSGEVAFHFLQSGNAPCRRARLRQL